MIFKIECILKNESGIYKISNSINDKIYIGSAVNLSARFRRHKHHLLKNNHHSPILQSHVNKYGIETLSFELIETCDKSELLTKEQQYLTELQPVFNICLSVKNSRLGIKMPEEAIKKAVETKRNNGTFKRISAIISERNKGNKNMTGKKHSDETKIKIGAKSIGRKNKGSKHFLGKKHSHETKKKISIKAMGNKRNLGRILSEETKLKISKANKGKTHVQKQETRNKIRETMLRKFASKRMLSVPLE
jgi:group I intron endonuclease